MLHKAVIYRSILVLLMVAIFSVVAIEPMLSQDLTKGQKLLFASVLLSEDDYSIPSWTQFLTAKKRYETAYDSLSEVEFVSEFTHLQSKNHPYSIALTVNGDPTSGMGIAWFTNRGNATNIIELVEGLASDSLDFLGDIIRPSVDTININRLNYCNFSNHLSELASIDVNSKRSYTSHKSLISNLKPNTTYSYRVGEPGCWSSIGHFETAPIFTSAFKFIYITDTQADNNIAFDVATKAVQMASRTIPDAKFCLVAGDLVQSTGGANSEWEWEQWFGRMQPVWLQMPIVPLCGNHDKSINHNFSHHFNTQSGDEKQQLSKTPGSVYSFVYGDALFMAINTEDYAVSGYLDSLSQFVTTEVNKHTDIPWKIILTHKSVYAGSSVHQNDLDGRIVREKLVPLFDFLGIDLVLQGHDHIYEIIGPTKNYKPVENSAFNVSIISAGGVEDNMTGKSGGIFDVSNGTLYFLNGNAGAKKYTPRSRSGMEASFQYHGVHNYFDLFSGKFGQSYLATFSEVEVSSEKIEINTYSVNAAGDTANLYDSFSVIKPAINTGIINVKNGLIVNELGDELIVSTKEIIKQLRIIDMAGHIIVSVSDTNVIDLSNCVQGLHILQVIFIDKLVSYKLLIKQS